MWGNQGGNFGGDQGGGYLNSPGGFGSPSSQPEKKQRTRAQNIMPVTVAQVLAAQHDNDQFLVDGVELNQVTLVGMIRSVNEASTRLDYELDDNTGPFLEVRQFVDNDENTAEEERTVPMRENTYVRAFGHVRAFGGKRSVVAFRLQPIMDMNELTTHLLEVVHTHISMTKGLMNNNMGGQTIMETTAPGGGEYPGAQAGDMMSGLNGTQAQVAMVIKSCTDEQGVSISYITQKLRGIPQKAIAEALEFLSSEGHIYSTIDDEHFRSTDTM